MTSATTFAAATALFVAFSALFNFHDPPTAPSTSTSPEATALDGADAYTYTATATAIEIFEVLVLLAATVALFAAVAFLHLRHAAAGSKVAGNKRILELAIVLLCGAVGTLNFILFVLQPAADVAVGDVGALARALGAAAAHALPASATVTFFLSITLVIAHIRAGGEGGGTGPAANHRGVVDLLKKLALGAAAALLIQMALTIYSI